MNSSLSKTVINSGPKQEMEMRAVVIAAMLALGGCMTSGTQLSETQLATIEKGKTTYDEVVARLGEPTTLTVAEDGTRVATYGYAKGNSAAVIPIASLFAGGLKIDAVTTTFTFDSAGVLKDYTTTTKHIEG